MFPKVHAGMDMEMNSNMDCGKSKGIIGEKSMQILVAKMKKYPVSVWRTVWKVGRDDPRRVIHAVKVGLSLTLVSLLYLLQPLFTGIGQNAIWAVMTVVVVLEFTAG